MPNLDDSQIASPWGHLALDPTLSAKFSDIINDDFLIVDGLNLCDDLDVSATEIFDEGEIDFLAKDSNDSNSSSDIKDKTREKDCVHQFENVGKMARVDRSRSPIPKRSRSTKGETKTKASPSQITSCGSLAEKRISLDDLQRDYKRVVDQLAMSMRRSEITRSKIISFKNAAKSRTRGTHVPPITNADGFLSGAQPTLTVGLAQSRQMLTSYASSLQSPPPF